MKRLVNKPNLKNSRKDLRNSLTSPEAVLWKELKSRKLEGFKFRRQHSIGNYILDFYCADVRLGIELDGHDHFTEEGLKRDEKRDAYLKSKGVHIIRIENKFVFDNMEQVLNLIADNLK